MLRNLAFYSTLAVMAGTGAVFAGTATRSEAAEVIAAPAQHRASPGTLTGNSVVPGQDEAGTHVITPALLGSIAAWLAETYGLPSASELPRVAFASPLKLVSMRYKGLMPYAWREDSILNPSAPAAHQREVVAIYDDKTRTIFLPQGWTGETHAERSILVHEMVHHLQNTGGLRYECPAGREKLAYEAQDDWLKLHGLSLEKEFEVDMLTVLVTSACMS